MSRATADEIARQTATVSGVTGSSKRVAKRAALRPLVRQGALYWATEVQDACGVAPVAFAEWKRLGLTTYYTPAGDLVRGEDVIEFMQKHRVKPVRHRGGS